MLTSLVQKLYLELNSEPEAASWVQACCEDSPATRGLKGSPPVEPSTRTPKPVFPVVTKSIHYPKVQYQVKPLRTLFECNKPSPPPEPREHMRLYE